MAKPFVTADLNLAAFLTVRGHSMQDARSDGRQCVFTFGADVAKDATAFYLGEKIPARQFAAAQRDLKGLVARLKSRPPIPPSPEVPHAPLHHS